MIRKTILLYFFLLILFQGLANEPQRIISLAPSVTKSLYALGAEDLLVGCTSFCILQNPDDAQIVASAILVNLEKALLLKPDLVIASSLTKPETLAMFEKMGVKTICFSYPKSFNDLCLHLQQIGEEIGKKEEADRIVNQAKCRIKELKKQVPFADKKPKIFFQIGANPLYTVVPNTFLQDFINFANCENIASDLTIGSITRESVLVRNPDVIFVILMGSLSSDEKQRWESYKSLRAVKNNKVFVMDSETTCSPTPLQFAQALEEMIKNIYSE